MAEKAEKLKEIWDDYISNAGKAASSFARSSKQYAEGVKNFVTEINAKASFTDEDKDLIDRICFTAKNNNPIAAKGRAACPDHEDIIKEKDFLEALNNFKSKKDSEAFQNFQKKWESYIKEGTSKCPILVNRAAVAMDDKLCVLVNYLRLKEVGEWLQEKEFIEKINEKPKKENWYKFNVELMAHIKKSISFDEAKLEEKYMLKVFPWYLYEHYVHPKPIKKQEIRYGAPGTGKTYGVKEDVKTHFELWASQYEGIDNINVEFEDHFKLVQFHPSYTYEAFIEGLFPNKNGKLILKNGTFKSFCKEAAKWEIDYYNLKEKRIKEDDKFLSFDKIKLDKDVRTLITTNLNDSRWKSIKKYIEKNDNTDDVYLIDLIPPYYFVIDEINRAELSRVFGELMYCLEYRGVEGKIKTQYAELNTDNTKILPNGEFFIPYNVYFFGTMNTIDRSIESFDFALRRRFQWTLVPPNYDVLQEYLENLNGDSNYTSLRKSLENLNKEIEKDDVLGEDFIIGQGYLMNLEKYLPCPVSILRDKIWENSISPLLQEYLRGTGKKEDCQKKLKKFKEEFFKTNKAQ